ncbi:MAG: bifunctional precorrin-2 dehydrogenase/sirohydrochlorin ferrochelatase [Chloroflexota bacterium]
MSEGYPLVLRLTGRRCVVVGGGAVAARKLAALVNTGAELLVVAPVVSEEIERLVSSAGGRLERRPFEPSDLDGATLAFAATNQTDVNRAVVEAAMMRGVLVNVADDPAACDFTVPAVVRRGDVALAISTGGRSPAFARFLREQLAEWLTDSRCQLLDLVAELRRELLRDGRSPDGGVWKRALADQQVGDALEAGNRDSARSRLLDILAPDL